MVRFKYRYLLISLLFPNDIANPFSKAGHSVVDTPTEQSLHEGDLMTLLRESLALNFGDVGAGEVSGSFVIKYLSPATKTLIIRVSAEHFRSLWAAITLLRRVGGQEVVARVVHVSGTMRKTQHAAIRQSRLHLLKQDEPLALSNMEALNKAQLS